MYSADYAVARCLFVCLSVRLSHVGILSKRLNIASYFFSPSGKHIILVFRTKRYGSIPTGVSNAMGMKNCDFRPISRFSKMIQNGAIVTMEGEFSNGAIFDDLE